MYVCLRVQWQLDYLRILLVLQVYRHTHTSHCQGINATSIPKQMCACTILPPRVAAPCPAGAARGQAFVQTESPKVDKERGKPTEYSDYPSS